MTNRALGPTIWCSPGARRAARDTTTRAPRTDLHPKRAPAPMQRAPHSEGLSGLRQADGFARGRGNAPQRRRSQILLSQLLMGHPRQRAKAALGEETAEASKLEPPFERLALQP